METSKSPIVQEFLSRQDKELYGLTAQEAEQHGVILMKIIQARNRREQPRDEFDSLSYEMAYLSNKRASYSYLKPKKNDDEVRIVTGITEKRIELVWNELLAMNFEEEITAFDKEDEILQEVGEVFTDVVKRTEQMELADEKDVYIFLEMLTQPSVFIEELWVQQPDPSAGKKSINNKMRCERRMLQGVQIYLGDINLPGSRFNEQPFIVKYERMDMAEAKRRIRPLNPEKFDKYVREGQYDTLGASTYELYRKWSVPDTEVEAYWYYSVPDNEIQVYCAGVPLLKLGTKYTDIVGDMGGYHIMMDGLKPYSGDFAYYKPLTQSAKTLQALDDETIRNLIRKFRQAVEPPLGVTKGKVFSRDIWNPGAMAQGVKASDFERLIDHTGVTTSEMEMYKLIQEKTNEFIGAMAQQPLQTGPGTTATEIQEAQKMAVKMLGQSVLSAIRIKKKMAMLRARNIYINYTKPTGKELDPISKKVREVYAKFTLMDADVGDTQGTKSIEFTDQSMDRDQKSALFSQEEKAKEQGKPFKKSSLNVKALKEIDTYFHVNVVAKERESSQLDKVVFGEAIQQAAEVSKLTGRRLNADKLTSKFERVHKEKDMFEKAAPEPTQMEQMQSQQTQGGQGGQKPKAPNRPTVNTATNAGQSLT